MNILFIDDSVDVLETVKALIQEVGHQVILESSAVNVMDNFQNYQVDVVFTDMLMPMITGIDLLKYINEHSPSTPVVIVTGHSDLDSAIAAIRLGAFDYLVKPVTFDALQTCLLRLEQNVKLNKRLKKENERRLKSEAELTVRDRVQKELEKKNQMLEQLTKELQEHQAQLVQSEKMAAVGLLTAGIAHEINNPISFIKTNLGVLKKYNKTLKQYITETRPFLEASNTCVVSDDLRASLGKIDFISDDLENIVTESCEGAERIHEIVQNLKNFAREDSKKPIEFDVNEGIESTLKIIWNELKYKCTVKKEYGTVPMLNCFGGELNQVFMNLLVNAAHAIKDKGVVSVRTWTDENNVFIEIADNGCGIAEKDLGSIFNPFFTTKEQGKGTGLGLSISYKIIEKHNGNITVKSDVGKGTAFTISIPM